MRLWLTAGARVAKAGGAKAECVAPHLRQKEALALLDGIGDAGLNEA
jgi:hypothetical protein